MRRADLICATSNSTRVSVDGPDSGGLVPEARRASDARTYVAACQSTLELLALLSCSAWPSPTAASVNVHSGTTGSSPPPARSPRRKAGMRSPHGAWRTASSTANPSSTATSRTETPSSRPSLSRLRRTCGQPAGRHHRRTVAERCARESRAHLRRVRDRQAGALRRDVHPRVAAIRPTGTTGRDARRLRRPPPSRRAICRHRDVDILTQLTWTRAPRPRRPHPHRAPLRRCRRGTTHDAHRDPHQFRISPAAARTANQEGVNRVALPASLGEPGFGDS